MIDLRHGAIYRSRTNCVSWIRVFLLVGIVIVLDCVGRPLSKVVDMREGEEQKRPFAYKHINFFHSVSSLAILQDSMIRYCEPVTGRNSHSKETYKDGEARKTRRPLVDIQLSNDQISSSFEVVRLLSTSIESHLIVKLSDERDTRKVDMLDRILYIFPSK